MHERFARCIEDRLSRLGQRVQRARRPLDVRKVERQIGRLLEQNQHAAARYVIEFVPDATLSAGVRLDWHAQPEWDDWARWSEGCYVLGTNVTDWTPDKLWRTYIQLTDAEAAFRIQKSELGIRPVWHQRADRVQAHILVCFLAYVLWKTLGSGNDAPASAKARAPSSTNSNAFRAPMSCCRPRTGASSACAVWCAWTPPKRRFSIASASSCPSDSGFDRRASNPPPCSADFFAKCPKLRLCPLELRKLG